jgi:hypothetical protein
MTQKEQEELREQVLAKEKEFLQKYGDKEDKVELIFSESTFPENLKGCVYRAIDKIGKWTICIIDLPKKAGVLTVLVIISLILESLNFYYAQPEHVDEIRYQISQPNMWDKLQNPNLNGFVIVPPRDEPNPHVPERDFIANPQATFAIASLSGLSLQVSGKYPGN